MPTTMPSGVSNRARNASGPAVLAPRSGDGGPPQKRSDASDHTPTRASRSTTFSNIVSMARKAISTLVTGLPRPVAPAFAAAAGASVGAGSGRSSTPAASAAAIPEFVVFLEDPACDAKAEGHLVLGFDTAGQRD